MNLINLQTLPTSRRLWAWAGVSLALLLGLFWGSWDRLGTMLSPQWVFGQNYASPWGVLGLCLIWLYLKRKEIGQGLASRWVPSVPLGLALVGVALLLPPSQDFLVLRGLVGVLGAFMAFFGRGARIPAILLGIYGFAIAFPLAIKEFAELPYSMTVLIPMMGLLPPLGLPIEFQGQWVQLLSSNGDNIRVAVTAACAGPATMGVLLAIFALMMLDTPLPPKRAVGVFLFGIVGTWFQSFLRLIVLMVVGYLWGEEALWTAHFWTIYLLFPLWYLLFAYVYFRQATQGRVGDGSKG